jgi:hypothetical protein
VIFQIHHQGQDVLEIAEKVKRICGEDPSIVAQARSLQEATSMKKVWNITFEHKAQ